MTNGHSIPQRIFITGTDTGIGKTVLSAALCIGFGAGYWKPVQAGTSPDTDTERVREWTRLPASHFYPETYRLQLPMSPHAAAEREGVEIALDDFHLPDHTQDRLVVEGAGGLLVPINRRRMMLDLILHLQLPVLLVAGSGLGTINHTLMSIRMLELAGGQLWGVALNGERHPSNEDAIAHFGAIGRLFSFPRLPEITPGALKSACTQTFPAHAS